MLIGDCRASEKLANVPYLYTDDAKYWLNSFRNSDFQLNMFLDNVLIGRIGVNQQDNSHNLGYWIGFEYWVEEAEFFSLSKQESIPCLDYEFRN